MMCPLTFLVSYRLFDSAKALAFENVPNRDEVSLRCIQFIYVACVSWNIQFLFRLPS